MGPSRVRAPGVSPAPGAVAAVARVALLCPDLLFGSRLRSALENAGHEVLDAAAEADVLVVDLTDDAESRVAAAAGSSMPVLGF